MHSFVMEHPYIFTFLFLVFSMYLYDIVLAWINRNKPVCRCEDETEKKDL